MAGNELSTKDKTALPDGNADLETVLAAWHAATLRLERTHSALQAEVCRLTDELEVKNRELARKNRLADLGQMASHVAHEVRNNLVPVALYMSLLRRRLADTPNCLEVLEKIEAGFTALDATVNDLLHFTIERDPQRQPVDIGRLVEEVHAALAPQLMAQGITTTVDVAAGHVVAADCDMLRRAVLNLVLNALDAMPEGGDLIVTSYVAEEGVELEIADTGPGMSEETRRRAFEPFFTTRNTGTGLGLAIVSRIAEAHNGDVRAVNCPDGGTAVTLRIPHRILKAAA